MHACGRSRQHPPGPDTMTTMAILNIIQRGIFATAAKWAVMVATALMPLACGPHADGSDPPGRASDSDSPAKVLEGDARASSYLRVTLPAGVQPSDLAPPSESVRRMLDAAVRAQLSQRRPSPDVVVLLGPDGQPILPDAERARKTRRERASGVGAPSLASDNELTFTFNSPTVPWTPEELASVQGWLAACYPIAKTVYVPPAFANTVNVSKGDAAACGGFYNATTNEIVLIRIAPDVVCHEMVHGFHDDDIVGMSTWEEGMTRATEIEITKRAGLPDPVSHDDEFDVHYEELNQPPVASINGAIFAGWGQTLLRYQLSGYAWGKAMLEDATFFPNFNASYYAQALADPDTPSHESALLGLVQAAKPAVENLPFGTWYPRQRVLNTQPPVGDFVYVRTDAPSRVTVAVFNRRADGVETNLPEVIVEWWVYDDKGAIVDASSDVTNEGGAISFNPLIPLDYNGRLNVTAVATLSETTTITTSRYVKAPEGPGVFGVVTGADTGSITLTPLDQAVSSVTVPVSRGGFDAPTLAPVKGRIQYVFTDGTISTSPAVFTKDENAPYFVHVTFGNTIAPVADAYVRDGTSASTNFGTDPTLAVKTSSSGFNRVSYLRFSMTGVRPSVTRAT